MQKNKYFLLIFLILGLAACSSGSGEDFFVEPRLAAVDSTNDRLFVLENNGALQLFNASAREEIGEQPLVNEDNLTSIHALLPSSPSNLAVITTGSISRLFITGGQNNTDGEGVLNQILVLDYDGTTLSEASFSPITVVDSDDATDNTNDILGGLEIDTTNSRLYVTNTTLGALFIYSTTDGSEVRASLDIDGSPNKMSLDGDHLYVANSTSTAADQVITVINTTDFTTTEIDLDIPTNDISVISNGTGTVMLAKLSTLQRVFVRTIDTTTFASSTAIPAGDSSVTAGEINTDTGITASIGGVLLAKDSTGIIYGYVPQSDGQIEYLTVLADLSSFTASVEASISEIAASPCLYTNSDGTGITVYIPASGTGDLLYSEIGSTDLLVMF